MGLVGSCQQPIGARSALPSLAFPPRNFPNAAERANGSSPSPPVPVPPVTPWGRCGGMTPCTASGASSRSKAGVAWVCVPKTACEAERASAGASSLARLDHWQSACCPVAGAALVAQIQENARRLAGPKGGGKRDRQPLDLLTPTRCRCARTGVARNTSGEASLSMLSDHFSVRVRQPWSIGAD